MKYSFENPSDEISSFVKSVFKLHTEKTLGDDSGERDDYMIVARDDNNNLVGSVSYTTQLGCAMINVVVVSDSVRGLGVGSELMERVFEHSKSLGCTFALVNTYSFQAAPFYQKVGFKPIFEVPGFTGGHSKIFLRKEF